MIWLIDDQHLSSVLRGLPLPAPVSPTDQLATTGYWYVRLCQAVLGAVDRPGALSGPFLDLPHPERIRAIDALLALPDEIGLVSLRDLGPSVGRLRQRHQLNALSSEALAASLHLDASVIFSVASPKLQDALAQEHRQHVVRSPAPVPEGQRQSAAVAASERAADDQEFIDAISLDD